MVRQAGQNNGNNKDWQLWQQHNQPIELLTIDMFYQKLQYIHDNPVVAGFVEQEEKNINIVVPGIFIRGKNWLSYVMSYK